MPTIRSSTMPQHIFNVKKESHYRKTAFHCMVGEPKAEAVITLPQTGVLKASGLVPTPYDQGGEGSCTANAWAMGLKVLRAKQKLLPLEHARQYIYARERILDGNLAVDAGAAVGDGALVLEKFGVCSEATWPYTASNEFIVPSPVADAEAVACKLVSHIGLDLSPESLMVQLAQGRPCVFGFQVPASFESSEMARTGIMQMPSKGEAVLGGHCVVALDYVMTKRSTVTQAYPWYARLLRSILGMSSNGNSQGYFWVMNSWGAGWGQSGWFQMPFEVFVAVAFDPYAMESASV